MSKRVVILVLGLAAVIGGIVLIRHLSKPPEKTDEQVLLALIDHIGEIAERRKIGEMRPYLSKDYRDGKGNDYELINAFLMAHFLRHGTLSVYVLRKSVEVDRSAKPPSATMKVTTTLTRSPKVKQLRDLLRASAITLRFDLKLVKGARWQLTWADWNRADLRSLVK